jgi:hypothetical protein
MGLGGNRNISKGVTGMKFVATFLVAVFVVAAGTSFAFADCAGHNKAQLVKNQAQEQEQVTKDQPTNTPLSVAEKTPEPAKTEVKVAEKK